MSSKEVLERKDISEELKWDLESMYIDQEAWNKDYERAVELAKKFENHKGNIVNSSDNLYNALKDRDELYRLVEHIYSYTHLKLDEDTRLGSSQELADKGMSLIIDVEDKTSFFVPEILTIDNDTIAKYLFEKEELKLYKQYLEDLFRQKDHILSAREESIIAQFGEVASAPEKIFSMLNDADLTFPTIKDENGNDVEITSGNFIPLMESNNREVRKNAFKELYKTYYSFRNTFAAALSGDLKNNVFNAKLRNFKNSREASLSANNIPLGVYDNLIKAIHNNLDTMYKYMDIRKRVLKLDELHMYDLYVPIVQAVDFSIPYDEGVELIKKALAPLKNEYLTAMNEGFNSRWIDIKENRGKRSGAYSGGSYDSKPYILLNYHDTLDNVFTVAHEMGHSMHSYFTRRSQPFVYGDYSIFVAEVASTANEALLLDYMLKNVRDKNEKLYLLNHYLESFRTTVFRQTMFAEFEQIIHEHIENGGALTADYLCETYKKLNQLYYGPNIIVDEEIAIEWARIPHFYYNYYVFQYATGFSAAVALSEKILKEGDTAVDSYLNFLKSGSSDYPINVLRKAGVDMTTEEPVNYAMGIFKRLVDEFDELIQA
ncbi:oligoendopeptidase F [Tissierella sp. Yu-01]|uniref:oligoendopeptidase F n=1 Tax=Tissierella sp. Yu-01 TaxID=3035694 RepID=UPI00240DF068|nr:oligoendopeptidase F [Tissierella sp. Yu-01]WFA09428.1 oligoendopeptidase F [Tissierella sp. Yu-01]